MIIYKVTNLKNGKIYIGQTVKSLSDRRYKHEYDANRIDRKTVKFHNALLKDGFDSFKWEVLLECATQDELDYYEKFYISEYESYKRDKGYNLKLGGKFGGIFTDESKESLGESTKKKWQNPETAKKMLEGLRKGTETCKRKSEDNYIQKTCPICGNVFKFKPYDRPKKYCTRECSKIALKDFCRENCKIATNSIMLEYEKEREKRYSLICEWVKNNTKILANISMNNLTFLQDLAEYIGVKDVRTVAKVLGLKYKKELAKALVELNENIC